MCHFILENNQFWFQKWRNKNSRENLWSSEAVWQLRVYKRLGACLWIMRLESSCLFIKYSWYCEIDWQSGAYIIANCNKYNTLSGILLFIVIYTHSYLCSVVAMCKNECGKIWCQKLHSSIFRWMREGIKYIFICVLNLRHGYCTFGIKCYTIWYSKFYLLLALDWRMFEEWRIPSRLKKLYETTSDGTVFRRLPSCRFIRLQLSVLHSVWRQVRL